MRTWRNNFSLIIFLIIILTPHDKQTNEWHAAGFNKTISRVPSLLSFSSVVFLTTFHSHISYTILVGMWSQQQQKKKKYVNYHFFLSTFFMCTVECFARRIWAWEWGEVVTLRAARERGMWDNERNGWVKRPRTSSTQSSFHMLCIVLLFLITHTLGSARSSREWERRRAVRPILFSICLPYFLLLYLKCVTPKVCLKENLQGRTTLNVDLGFRGRLSFFFCSPFNF